MNAPLTPQRAISVVCALTLITQFLINLGYPATTRAIDLPLVGITQIDAGYQWQATHQCAVADGGLKCWGSNSSGQLGTGNNSLKDLPTDVSGLDSGVAQVTTGQSHTCARRNNGRIQCWGHNYYGQLGNDHASSQDETLPVDVVDIGHDGEMDAVDVSAGYHHTCAIVDMSSVPSIVVCWGDNDAGQLGVNGSWQQFEKPELPVLKHDGTALENIKKVSAGGYHTCALLNNGSVWCWGAGSFGQLGDGDAVERRYAVPVQGLSSGVQDISAGGYFTCAALEDGRVACWGENNWGQLGDLTTTDRHTPAFVKISGAIAIDAGHSHTCAIVDQPANDIDHAALCWGENNGGQLGDDTLDDSADPRPVSGLGSGVLQIAAGYGQTCARLTGGTMKCWGYNNIEQLGTGRDDYLFRTPQTVIVGELSLGQEETPIDIGDVEPDVPAAPRHDYGDAPDDTISGMLAYAGVAAHFPTLSNTHRSGPRHLNLRWVYLGTQNSVDAPTDADGTPNLDSSNLLANLDGGDEGWLNQRQITRIDPCGTVDLRLRLRHRLTQTMPLYLNVWFDGNRDGDWKDEEPCRIGGTASEWIVRDYNPNPLASTDSIITITTRAILSNSPANPAWLRISLSDRPAIVPSFPPNAIADGRGPFSDYFNYGETEDYLWDPVTLAERYGTWDIHQTVTVDKPYTMLKVGDTLSYTVDVSRDGGSTSAVTAKLLDVLPPEISLVGSPVMSVVSPTISTTHTLYEPDKGGPSGRVSWQGTLSAGSKLRFSFQARIDACPNAAITNTARLLLPGPGTQSNDATYVPMNCLPPEHPTLTLNKQRVDAIGATTLSDPNAAISETVYLMTLSASPVTTDVNAGISDLMPTGLKVVEVFAPHGTVTVTKQDHIAAWQGTLTAGIPTAQFWVRAQVDHPAVCGTTLTNTAVWGVRLPNGELLQDSSNSVTFTPLCAPTAQPTATATGRPTYTPTPRPTYTPVPVATNTPVPLPSDAPIDAPTNTPVPRATNTSVPLPTLTPTRRRTNTPVPVATNTSVPLPPDASPGAPTNTPVPRATNTSVPLVLPPEITAVYLPVLSR